MTDSKRKMKMAHSRRDRLKLMRASSVAMRRDEGQEFARHAQATAAQSDRNLFRKIELTAGYKFMGKAEAVGQDVIGPSTESSAKLVTFAVEESESAVHDGASNSQMYFPSTILFTLYTFTSILSVALFSPLSATPELNDLGKRLRTSFALLTTIWALAGFSIRILPVFREPKYWNAHLRRRRIALYMLLICSMCLMTMPLWLTVSFGLNPEYETTCASCDRVYESARERTCPSREGKEEKTIPSSCASDSCTAFTSARPCGDSPGGSSPEWYGYPHCLSDPLSRGRSLDPDMLQYAEDTLFPEYKVLLIASIAAYEKTATNSAKSCAETILAVSKRSLVSPCTLNHRGTCSVGKYCRETLLAELKDACTLESELVQKYTCKVFSSLLLWAVDKKSNELRNSDVVLGFEANLQKLSNHYDKVAVNITLSGLARGFAAWLQAFDSELCPGKFAAEYLKGWVSNGTDCFEPTQNCREYEKPIEEVCMPVESRVENSTTISGDFARMVTLAMVFQIVLLAVSILALALGFGFHVDPSFQTKRDDHKVCKSRSTALWFSAHCMSTTAVLAVAHYLCELVAWLGVALVAQQLNALLVFAGMASYLSGRAVATTRWYRAKFGDAWPARRRHLVPFIF